MNVLVQGIQEFLVVEDELGILTTPTQGRKVILGPKFEYKRFHLVQAETATEAEQRVTEMWRRDDETTRLRIEKEDK